MKVDYSKYWFCPRCQKKHLIVDCKKRKSEQCPDCGSSLRQKRHRILTDYIERRNKKDLIVLASEYLPINKEGSLLLEDLKDFADRYLFS